MDFESVLAAAHDGAEWAWTRIYDEHAGAVLGYLRAQRIPDPENVAGEVFLQVVRDIGRFSGDERGFRSWVLGIAHHRLLDERRRASRRPEVLGGLEPLERAAETNVEQAVLASLSTERIVELLGALTPDQRNVLLLRILGGLTIEETASIVGKRPGAAKAAQRRGLEVIRRMLGDGSATL